MSAIELTFSTTVAAPRHVVWERVSSMDGVNHELGPFVKMTHPADLRSLADVEVVPGKVLHRCWLLAGGIVPFDRHDLALERVLAGEGFDEESTTWLQRRWRHERRLADAPGGGTTVSDRLVIEPRIALATPVTRLMVSFLFRHRHKRLARAFGL